ncbi:Sec-independent protein translocase subunit TatB [Sulfurimonas aquatica]|uniref:Sec-independent protein translocase protein TatB homolog n=1 Tax=Sulfurimonas aquatica TaxID=2672570 RepID=A0A975GDE3_9BACT|nr:Sec-independent protein translocase protein TatB [Sulfurimonas aquatica]QSZ42502.1 Sec-independent protein translocase subunit TatB [Sulfurimonas aquatica]
MFGMGFTEILIIAVIAILFLGPDKLPSAMIDIAKFFKNAKNTLGSVKSTLEEEMHVSDIKKEALAYKAQLEKATSALDDVKNIPNNLGLDTNSFEDTSADAKPEVVVNKSATKAEEVTFAKKSKKIEEDNTDV